MTKPSFTDSATPPNYPERTLVSWPAFMMAPNLSELWCSPENRSYLITKFTLPTRRTTRSPRHVQQNEFVVGFRKEKVHVWFVQEPIHYQTS